MSITIGGYAFDGPHTQTGPVAIGQGIYSILDYRPGAGGPYVLDIGEAGDVRRRLDSHDRKEQWRRNSRGTLACAVLYTTGWTDQQRRDVESRLRQQYAPPCGDR